MSTLKLNTPEWLEDFLQPMRYKGAYGGRGSGKSHGFAEMLIESHIMNPDKNSVCIREVQKTLSQSVKKLLENKIADMNASSFFDISETVIKSRRGCGMIIFMGMQNHTADSIKSLEGYDCAWVEEAQSLSHRSLDLLRPTIRKNGSEIWFTWNPYRETDAVDQFLRSHSKPSNSIVKAVSYFDNPWFPEALMKEVEYDQSRDIDKYNHVWIGEYASMSELRVFKNWVIEEFERPLGTVYRLGADWGFSVDPSVMIRCSVDGNRLYIDYESYMIGCETVNLPDLFDRIPESREWFTRADGARPETIDYMRKHGYPKMQAAMKGKGSVSEGIQWLQSYNIVVHPRCAHMIEELNLYSYKRDSLTHEVIPIFEDKNNHCIDALRYACEGIRRTGNKVKVIAKQSGKTYYQNESTANWMFL